MLQVGDAIDELRESDEKENERDGAIDDWTERPKLRIVIGRASADADDIETAAVGILEHCPDLNESRRRFHLHRQTRTVMKVTLDSHARLRGRSCDHVVKAEPSFHSLFPPRQETAVTLEGMGIGSRRRESSMPPNDTADAFS